MCTLFWDDLSTVFPPLQLLIDLTLTHRLDCSNASLLPVVWHHFLIQKTRGHCYIERWQERVLLLCNASAVLRIHKEPLYSGHLGTSGNFLIRKRMLGHVKGIGTFLTQFLIKDWLPNLLLLLLLLWLWIMLICSASPWTCASSTPCVQVARTSYWSKSEIV